jgi:endonuclease/exonuclease/phosphatase family metal-dependent hydrolase
MLSVVTINSYASIPEPIRYNGLEARAAHFGQAFYESLGKNIDIICFQELVWNEAEILQNFTEHKYHTPIMKSGWFGSKKRFQESGLITISRYPIQKMFAMVFDGPTYHIERLCAKGALLVKVFIPCLGYVNVINTHLNAWSGERANRARDHQIGQIGAWLATLEIDHNEPLVFTGDWNIDFYEHSDIVNKLMYKLNAKILLPETTQFSFDPQHNPLVGLDAPDEYATISKSRGCVDEYLTRGTCPCCPRQLVDLFAISTKHLLPDKYEVNVIPVLYPTSFQIKVGMGIDRFVKHVSDHNAVLLTATFHSCKEHRIEISPNFGGEHCKEISYDVPDIEWEWLSLEIILSIFFGLLLFFFILWLKK